MKTLADHISEYVAKKLTGLPTYTNEKGEALQPGLVGRTVFADGKSAEVLVAMFHGTRVSIRFDVVDDWSPFPANREGQ